jgi:hypothetical protein
LNEWARFFLILIFDIFDDFADVPRESCTDSAALDKVVAFNRTCYDLQLNEGNTFAKARGSCLKQRGDLWNHVSKSAFELIVRELERRKHTMKVLHCSRHLFSTFFFIVIVLYLFLFYNGRLAVSSSSTVNSCYGP